MSAHAADVPGAIERRVDRLEWGYTAVDDRIKQNSARIDMQAQRQDDARAEATRLASTVVDIKDDVTGLKRTLDKLVWAIVGLALTIAGSAVGLALLIAAGGLHP